MIGLLALWVACAIPAPPGQPAPPPQAADPMAALRAKPLALTRHARCRMACRHFDEAEVRAFLASARWDPERSRDDGACPSHAFEGQTRDGQRARMVFADCPDEAKLVTAIDLDTDWPCECE